MDYLIATALIALSALFSGLTLGLLSLDTHTLKRRADLGEPDAIALYPIRRKGNLLLTTLLLGNVIVNTTLSILLGSIFSGLIAILVATALIFLLGEIIPQAVISRHAVWFGVRAAPLVHLAIWILYPIAKPISYTLDRLLGDEIPTVYSKHELMSIVTEHETSEHSAIDKDEERIVHGALLFSHTTVAEVMTPEAKVTMFEEHQHLTKDLLIEMNEYGFSRFPIYKEHRSNIVGLLFTKDLIVENDDIAINETKEAYEASYLKAREDELLDAVMARMLNQRRHIAVVFNDENIFSGVITLEDIIEEIIQFEIEDEDDD